MNFQPVRVGLLLRTLATMPDDAEVYVVEQGGRRVPLLGVGTLRDVNEVELGGALPATGAAS